MKTILSAIQSWTKKEINDKVKNSKADWNENDSSKDSYIKNRTHWEEVKQKYLIPETSVFISEDYGYESLSDSLPLLTVGQEYIVVLNGTTYKCIAREYDGSSAIIGNGTIYGDDNEGNGEPFSCDSYDDGSIYLNVATAGKYTISISIAQTEIHKIDSNYLPDNLLTTDSLLEVQESILETQDSVVEVREDVDENTSKLLTYTNTSCILPGYSYWSSVTYGNGKFVAVSGEFSATNYAAYSTDGINWESTTLPVSSYWSSVTYGDGKFVAVAGGTNSTNYAAYSTDGINWEKAILPSKVIWTSVTYGNGKFVAIAGYTNSYKIVAYSTDGINWEQVTLPVSSRWSSVTYGNGKFVAVAGYIGISSNYIVYSTDGINWKKSTLPVSAAWTSVTYGNGKFVAIDRGVTSIANYVAYSTDGINWESTTLPVSSRWSSVTYGNGKFVAVAGEGAHSKIAAYSTDGINWEQVTLPVSSYWSFVTYGDGKFVAIDGLNGNKYTMYSIDGINWYCDSIALIQDKEIKTSEVRSLLLDGYAVRNPTEAQPGQVLSVKTIDENNKPTEWEVVNAIKTVNNIAPDENGNVEVANLPSSAVSYEEQELTDEQKAQARANIGAVDFQSMTVRPLPILKRDHIKTQYREYYVTTVDIFELEKYVNYVNEPTVDGLDNTAKFVIVCDDGTEKMVATMQFGFVYSLTSKANIYSYLYFENQIIRVTSSDISTANNIEIVTSNTSVSNQINLHDTNETAHSDIRTVISGVSSLVGDVSVSEQVNTALDNYNADWDAVNGEPGHILNKPFGEKIILSDSPVVFNGDISNKEKIMIATNTYLVKVSESYVDTATMIGSELTICAGAYENTDVLTQDLVLDGNVVFGAEGAVVVFDNTPCVLSLPKDSTVQYSGVTFEVSKGTWFFYDSNTTDISYIKSLSCLYDKQEIIKKLDSKYLPDTVPLLEGKMTKVNPYFEGNIDGYTFLTFDGSNEEDGIVGLVKITDYILTEEECLGATITTSFEGFISNDTITKKVDFTDVIGLPCDAYYVDGSSAPDVIVIKSSGIGLEIIEGAEVSAGTYYLYRDINGMDGGKAFIYHFSALDNKEVVEEKINPKYLPSEVALKSDIPSIEGLASEEYVDNAIANLPTGGGGSSGGSSTNGNVYFNKFSTLYTVTAEDVENYTAGDAFIVSVDNLKGNVRIATINLRHTGGAGGTVLKKMDICGADPNKKYNNYRFASNPDCNNRTIDRWHDRWSTYIFTYGSDCIKFSGISNFSGAEAAKATRLSYWADQKLYPVTSFCISCVFDTLVEGLQIELDVIEEVSA